jgi:uncharacterized membrane protein
MNSTTLIGLIAVWFLLNFVACALVARSGIYTSRQVLIQCALIWCVPVIAVVVLLVVLWSIKSMTKPSQDDLSVDNWQNPENGPFHSHSGDAGHGS